MKKTEVSLKIIEDSGDVEQMRKYMSAASSGSKPLKKAVKWGEPSSDDLG